MSLSAEEREELTLSAEEKKRLNELYTLLSLKCVEMYIDLPNSKFDFSTGFYNGHCHRTPDGMYHSDRYPIPVISVKGLCDIEIDFDGVSVTTKRRRRDAAEYPFQRLKGRKFEVYGVEDYCDTYYREGMSLEELRQNIAQSDEREIGFCFSFPFEVNRKEMCAFVKFLRREGFYY